MTPKNMALFRIAQRALKSAQDLPRKERIKAYQEVSSALAESIPELSKLAATAAAHLSEADESQLKLFQSLDTSKYANT